MSSLTDLTKKIIDQMPPSTRFQKADTQLLMKHKEELLALEPKLVAVFYDTLFSHATTRAVFTDTERPAREETLRHWWRRTVHGPFDEQYWTWQALVGVVHVKRKVKNPMMIGMWGLMLTTIRKELHNQIAPAELDELMEGMERLATTVQSLTAESYLEHYIAALREATGFNAELLDRMVANQVDDLLAAAKA
ncbi:MAG: globin [Chloroflexi bacterium]|nr:globin [Chloroflexota bacterium]